MGCGNPTGSGCAHYNPTVDDNPYVCKRCHICPECWDTRTTSCCHKHHRQLARIMIRYILRYMELEELKEGDMLFVHHKKIPQYLLPELAERNFKTWIAEVDDENVKLLIHH